MRLQTILSAKPYPTIRANLSAVAEMGPMEVLPLETVFEPGWVLHEFDLAKREAVFLQIVPETNLFALPFVYNQVMQATRAAFMSFEEFFRLTENLPLPRSLIHLFNIGHCGSTLMHHVFNAGAAACSISEPKFTVDLVLHSEGTAPEERVALARAGLKWLARLPGINPNLPLVLKHVSQSNRILECWHDAQPQAQNLFMFRGAEGYVASRHRFVQRRGFAHVLTPENWRDRWRTASIGAPESLLEGIVETDPAPLFAEMIAVCWALFMQDVAAAQAKGMVFHLIRFEAMKANTRAEIEAVFKVCNLPLENIGAALRALDKDSHEGTASARTKPADDLPPGSAARIANILQHPRLAVAKAFT